MKDSPYTKTPQNRRRDFIKKEDFTEYNYDLIKIIIWKKNEIIKRILIIN